MKINKIGESARQIMVNRYAIRDVNNKIVESPEQIMLRTAEVVARAENDYQSKLNQDQIKDILFKMMAELRVLPNGRTLANAGTKYGQLANCFVLPVEDDLGKGTDSIFAVLRKAILTLQTGGGVGFSFGRIRPKGGVISTSKGMATGAVSFIKVFDTAFWVIGQGGGRRSAAMATLPIWHPDVYEFIKCKAEEGQIENFNISVGLTDEFMKAVENDDDFALRYPESGELWKMVPARELFAEVVKYAYKNGEPGVLFLDRAERDNPVPNLYKLEATNPCGEQFLGPYENCCLASVNLAEHVKKIRINKAKCVYSLDWEKLAETVKWTVRMLDNVIDVNKYVPAVPELEEAAKKVRRIGVSVMGLADLMYQVGVRYGSKKGQEFASQVMEWIRFKVMKESIRLARYRGAFPAITGSIYDQKKMLWQAPKPSIRHKTNWGRPKIDWKEVERGIKQWGIRNGAQTTVAPTGSIATISELEGYGCEPVFALSYTRNTREGAEKEGKEWREIKYESKLFAKKLKEIGLSKKARNKVFDQVRQNGGSCQEITDIPKEIRDVFVVAGDLSVDEHVRMQAVMQNWVDNSISKTINFGPKATADEVAYAYQLGWKLGLKGMTVYVEGSRDQVVLEKKKPFVASGDDRMKCPECGGVLRIEEGCATCPSCAYSRCDK